MPRIQVNRQPWPQKHPLENECSCPKSWSNKVKGIILSVASFILCEKFSESQIQTHLNTSAKLYLKPDKTWNLSLCYFLSRLLCGKDKNITFPQSDPGLPASESSGKLNTYGSSGSHLDSNSLLLMWVWEFTFKQALKLFSGTLHKDKYDANGNDR